MVSRRVLAAFGAACLVGASISIGIAPTQAAPLTSTVFAGESGLGNPLSVLSRPGQTAIDSSGNLYIADTLANRVLKVAPGATTGTVVAGGNGYGTALNQVSFPTGVAVDAAGDVFVSDTGNNRVTEWAPGATAGLVVAGGHGAGTAANQLSSPAAIAVDGSGNLWIVDSNNSRVVEWLKGETQAALQDTTIPTPTGVTAAPNGKIYVVGTDGSFTGLASIIAYDPGSQTWSTEAQNLSVDPANVFATPTSNQLLIARATGSSASGFFDWNLTTHAEIPVTGYPSSSTALPTDITSVMQDASGAYLITDRTSNEVMKWRGGDLDFTRVFGAGAGSSVASLHSPGSSAFDSAGDFFIADRLNNRVVEYPANGMPVVVAGTGTAGTDLSSLTYPTAVAVASDGSLYIADAGNNRVMHWKPGKPSGTVVGDDGTGNGHFFQTPTGIALDNGGNLYVAEYGAAQVTRYNLFSGKFVIVAGGNGAGAAPNQLGGPGFGASASGPYLIGLGLAVDANGNVYVADSANNRVVMWPPHATVGTIVAGGHGYGTDLSQLSEPSGLVIDPRGALDIADFGNCRLVQWQPGATEGTLLTANESCYTGTGFPQFYSAIALDAQGQVYGTDLVHSGIFGWPAPPIPVTAPDAPTQVMGEASNASVQVSWTEPTNDGGSAITGYTVTASPGGAHCTTSALACTVTGLRNGIAYTFTVTATNDAGTSVASAASDPVKPVGPPSTPRGLTAKQPAKGKETVAWLASSGNGDSAISYAYRVSTNAGKSYGAWVNVGTKRSVTLTVKKGTAYAVQVRAHNSGGTSAPATVKFKPTK